MRDQSFFGENRVLMTTRATELRTKLQTICFSRGEIEMKKVAVVMKIIEQDQIPVFQEPQDFPHEGLISRSVIPRHKVVTNHAFNLVTTLKN